MYVNRSRSSVSQTISLMLSTRLRYFPSLSSSCRREASSASSVSLMVAPNWDTSSLPAAGTRTERSFSSRMRRMASLMVYTWEMPIFSMRKTAPKATASPMAKLSSRKYHTRACRSPLPPTRMTWAATYIMKNSRVMMTVTIISALVRSCNSTPTPCQARRLLHQT